MLADMWTASATVTVPGANSQDLDGVGLAERHYCQARACLVLDGYLLSVRSVVCTAVVNSLQLYSALHLLQANSSEIKARCTTGDT